MSHAIRFEQFLKKSTPTGTNVVCFLGTDYPLLFFAQLRMNMQGTSNGMIETINLKEIENSLFQSRLQTSFLGNSVIYFLKELDTLEQEKKQVVLTFLNTYHGPNTVCFFLPRDVQHQPASHWTIIELPSVIDKKVFSILITWYGIPLSSRIKEFIHTLFAHHDTVSLNTASLILNYLLLLGTQTTIFFSDWLEHIVVSEQSLFVLSQYFFQKNVEAFWEQWQHIYPVYGPPFWISFWSEQLWRASAFIMLNKKNQFTQARKIAFRLPFSFINSFWKRYGVTELNNAHHFLYNLDYNLKNGGSSCWLDLFYSKFFLKTFS
ncbi:MAG: hypothetical protein Q8Q25_01005 [bacterium]|nr:hypothetical protein [bacterium]